ncbi:nitrate- and nitrite sensing domain-containing protein [Streptomyces sp. VRA16 Mangrove soil]|uniref:sensor histidine kinase n=1 Tax=Streptomyces sp. VRA16 Mangrove soil TaxID=2817434 RepID=UPI001A9FFE66|nr:nitrate- and nitrite sensing domain-containing protein [Streptomyces sp. VRA16 Mangrove soil]MBO1335875.1 sensor histidine kinase [Streptomyces sp. VRA16 Mangrove soil]
MRRSKNGPEPASAARGNFTPPPRTAAQAAPVAETVAPAPSGGRMSPRNWRVPTKLNAILLIPVLVALVMGGFQVKSSIDTLNEAKDAEKTALIVRSAAAYSLALLNERDLSAQPILEGDRSSATVQKLYAATDRAKADFHETVKGAPDTAGLQRRLKLIEAAEPKLTALRKKAYSRDMDPVQTEEGYVGVQHYLMEISNELNLGNSDVTAYGRTVYALQLSKAAESLNRSIGMHLLVRPSAGETLQSQIVSFNSYAYLEGIANQEFVSGADPADVANLKKVLKGRADQGTKDYAALVKKQAAKGVRLPLKLPSKDGDVYQGMVEQISAGQSPQELAKSGVTPLTWSAVTTSKFEGYTEVENGLIDRAVNEASDTADNAQRDAYVTGAATVIAVLAAFIIAGMMARQMSRSMRRLRSAAFDVAEQRLPMLVDQLSRTEPGRVDTRVQPIPITTTDEIGEVARAFDQVHREAVRLAAEQALLRGNINAIFTNLSRRNQSLIEGQLTLITDLENNEADPDQLENLFRLDHLATRMRRNGENLLVLAGEEPGRRWDQPVPLVDVLRAATSEVEQYERIELAGVPEAEIHGRAVTDLVHLLAELLENATTFSSPQTKVRVTATRLPDGRVMIEIHDKGIGLTAEDFADINHKLANPPTVDAAISQRMGLFVVGRLSDRHGIRVQLRPSGEQAGTTSLVMLPDVITHGGGGEHQQTADAELSEFTVSTMIPTQQAFEKAPLRTAAELGFDDSRYEVPDDARELDPVGRSLMREERRAALEAQAQAQDDRPLFRDEVAPQQQGAPQAPVPPQQQDQQRPVYPEQPTYEGQQFGYDQQQQVAYDDQQQAGYDDPQQVAYDDQQQSGYDGYAPAQPAYGDGGPGGYEAGYAPQNGYAEAPAETFNAFQEPQRQADWQAQESYRDDFQVSYAPEAESAQSTENPAAAEPESVGFDPHTPAPSAGPSPSVAHEMTDAGLPRRGSSASQREETPAPATGGDDSDTWRSSNDERWERAEALKRPKAGGVTSSGLPRRVPRANLVEGTAEATPQGGPQVSRAPEDVRGRLSNLRRGVQRGRSEGNSDTNGQATWNQQSGPDSTYNQER